MTTRIALSVLIATLMAGVSSSAQSPGGQAPLAGRFVDPVSGLSLEQAIALCMSDRYCCQRAS